MNFIQPSIDPVLFSISFVDIRWYSISYILGFIIGSILIKKINKIKGNILTNKQLDNFFVYSVIGIIVGGRVGYVLFYQLKTFINDPLYLFEIWSGGMSFHGGLLGIIVAIYLFAKINKVNFYYVSDLVSIVAPIGLFFGRIANFINTELIGRPTSFFISVIYPSIDTIPRHPSQLYEALFEGIILFLILILYFFKNQKYQNFGFISGLFLIFYGLFRFFIEFLREPDYHIGLFLNLFSMGQLLCIPFLIFGIILTQKSKYEKY